MENKIKSIESRNNDDETRFSEMGYIRILTGTILGGIIGFYVMHRLETNYKEKMNETLRNYEAELKRKKDERLNELEESSKF